MVAKPSNLIRILILFRLCLLIKGQAYPNSTVTVEAKDGQQSEISETCAANTPLVPISSELPFTLESDFSLKHIYDPTYVSVIPGCNPGTTPKNSYTDLGTADAMLEKLITLDFAGSATSTILTQTIEPSKVRPKWEEISNRTRNPRWKSITLIDNTNPAILLQDLNRNVPIPGGRRGGQTFYRTKSKYQVTRITLKYDPVVHPDNIVVYREQYRSMLTLGFKTLPDGGEELIHFDKLNPKTLVNGPDAVGEISLNRLKVLAESKSVLRTYLGLTSKQHPNMKRSDVEAHVQYSISCTQGISRLRSAGSSCAFSADYQDPKLAASSNQKVGRDLETIEPADLVETHKKGDTGTKPNSLIEIQEGNQKVSGDAKSIEESRTIKRLQALEGHANVIRKTSSLVDPGEQKHVSVWTAWKNKLNGQKFKISQTAVARNIDKFANSKRGQYVFTKLDKVTKTVKWTMLTKNFITGILHEDYTKLGILGVQTGFEGIEVLNDYFNPTESATSLGRPKVPGANKVTAAGKLSKVSKSSKIFQKFKSSLKTIAKVAAPISFGVDIGLSLFSLTKSALRIQNAKDKYEVNDAVADIVVESVSMVVNTAAYVLSAAFPPYAPLIQAGAFLINTLTSVVATFYKAYNEVDQINEQIPLSNSEKAEQRFLRNFDIFGTRKPNYVDNLVAVKKANTLIVKHYLETLESHPELAGIVFPGRTMIHPGSCRLTKVICGNLVGFIIPFASLFLATTSLLTCTGVLKSGVIVAKDCPEYGSRCEHIIKPGTLKDCKNEAYFSGLEYGKYECECDKVEVEIGLPRKDNLVDFTQKKNVYLERSVPDDVSGGFFKCKPGSVHDRGIQVSQRYTSYDYHCEAAIALLRSNESSQISDEQVMLFLLEDGNDTVQLDPSSTENNHYEITSGHKEFYGGAGSDTFQLAGPCSSLSGTLDGREGQDTLIVTENCMNESIIPLDFSQGERVRVGSLDLYVNSIESFIGRKNQTEEVILSPAILHVNTNGGSPLEADIIKVPNHSSNYSTTIIASGNTEIILDATRGRFQIEANDEANNTIRIFITLPLLQNSAELSITTIMELPSEFIALDFYRVISSHSKIFIFISVKTKSVYMFYLRSHKPLASLSSKSTPELFFILKEDSAGSLSYLTMSPSPHIEPSIYHPLSLKSLHSTTLPSTKRIGSSNIKNVFDIKDGPWEAVGGDKDDEFILHSDSDKWILNGQGGNDVLQFDASLENQHLEIDLVSGSGLNDRLQITNINTVILPKNFACHVMCGCDTSGVFAMGGSLLQKITVSSSSCENLSLEILVSGNSQLSILQPVTWPSYVFINIASFIQQEKQHLNVTATIPSSSGVVVIVQHDGIDWVQDKAVAGSSSPGNGTYRVTLSNPEGELVDLTIDFFSSEPKTSHDDVYFTHPSINFQTSDGHPRRELFIEKATGFAKVLHMLHSSDNNENASDIKLQRRGMLQLENVFQIISSDFWHIEGGNQSDVFSLQANKFDGMVLDGGVGGENVLIVSPNTTELSILTIDLVSGYVKFRESPIGGVIKRFHHILGRDNLPDVIIVRCGILTVNGQGGSKSPNRNKSDVYSDRIIIQSSCSEPIRIQVPSHTIVKNSALEGVFHYTVTDANTTCLTFKSTETNSHNIIFLQQPWEIIEKISLEEFTSVLQFKLKNGKVHVFPMANVQNGIFLNPNFKFQFNDGSILCQLHVTPDGTTHTVYSISQFPSNGFVHGLPVTVNNFMINVTQEGVTKSSSNYSLGIQGSNSTIHNYFFIYNLAYPIQLLDGRGGQGSSNQLQIAEEFYPNHTILFHMHPRNGQLSVGKITADNFRKHETVVIENVRNINEFVGRKTGKDTVHPHCSSTSVSMVEEIVISGDPSCMYGYNLTMEIGLETKVRFQSDMDEDAEDHYPAEGVFHYRFTSPRTFDIEGRDYVDGLHIYSLSFTIDQLESLAFNKDTETLTYTVSALECGIFTAVSCSHKMIASLNPLDQFYTQPQLLTQDGFHIRISRTGEVMMILGTEPYSNNISLAEQDIRQELVPLFLNVTKRLEATIIAGLSPEVVMHVGHGPSFKDRNVLQNSVNMTSHLVGGGANDTIYDIVDLRRDVYIYPGFDLDDCGRVDENDTKGQKQVIDLSDVVATIRQKHGNKYIPKTDNVGPNLVIKMIGHEDIYPGTVTIVNGTLCTSKLSLILYASKMSFKSSSEDQTLVKTSMSQAKKSENSSHDACPSTQWSIAPDPIFVPQGYVYTISPEDFEIGHEIRIQTNSSEVLNTTFEIARNRSDLFFTDIQAAVGKDQIHDATTIVVAGYFNTLQEEDLESNHMIDGDAALRNHPFSGHRKSKKPFSHSTEPPPFNETPELLRVVNVTVNLPGVNVVLSDTVMGSTSSTGTRSSRKPITPKAEDLNQVLHKAVISILSGFPNI